jgi:hypothetical protein
MLFRGLHVIHEQVDVAATPEGSDEIVIAQHNRTGECAHGIDNERKGAIVWSHTNLCPTTLMA